MRDGTGVTTRGVGGFEGAAAHAGAQNTVSTGWLLPRAEAVRRHGPAHDGITEGGKGRSDSPLPSQAQHAADHTRPKSM